ncbi:MAG: iron-sulfur cluster assembly protein [Myxococcota bacterium]|nr:iron-sulfur cluster assembly protein [Myxococcota bacterium]
MNFEEQIVEQLKNCYDPEIPVNIYDLGLIYQVEPETPTVTVRMTFTSESCPSAQEIPMDIRSKLLTLDGVEAVDFEIVWEPAWHPKMISEEARSELGIDDEALED